MTHNDAADDLAMDSPGDTLKNFLGPPGGVAGSIAGITSEGLSLAPSSHGRPHPHTTNAPFERFDC